MMQSMTGFGKSSSVFQSRKTSVEIRTLNSKGLDLSVKMPSIYKEVEPQIRKLVAEVLNRGKIELSIHIESEKASEMNLVNKELATSIYEELKMLNTSWGQKESDYLSMILRMPEVINTEGVAPGKEELMKVVELVKEACGQVRIFREKEGEDLQTEFLQRTSEISRLLIEIEPFEEERIQSTRERLQKGLDEFPSDKMDNNRFEQELIYYIEKLDIAEEKMRLGNHIKYFLETIPLHQSGKKLGFIAQEMGREINTIGSKCNHSEMQKRVVQMKDSLEKIKEQILNTL
ncbi:MAG: YicC family protein [Crocinitomicaceae bacterium]|nr:YicC family protein [Crocinitomicaceae bacterium]